MPALHSISAALLAALITCAPVSAQQQQDREARPGGVMIVIEGQQVIVNGNVRGMTNSDLLPTSQQVRAITIDDRVRELVQQLDEPDFTKREDATSALIDLRVENVQFYAMLEHGELSAEQRHRLLGALRERIVNAPRGALGIQMDVGPRAAMDRIGVTIIDLIAGMPAERVLRVGDRITHIADEPVFSSDDLIALVQGRRPGDVIDLTVQRPLRNDAGQPIRDDNGDQQYDTLKIEMELGDAERLNDPRNPASHTRLDLDRRREVAAAEQRYGDIARPIQIAQP